MPERSNGLDDRVDLWVGDVRPDGEAQTLPMDPLRDWQGSFAQAQVAIRVLKMGRDRIVQERLDTAVVQVLLQQIAFRGSDDKEVPDMISTFGHRWEADRHIRKL